MPLTDVEMLIRLGTAIVLGGLIGFERELRAQPAGLRTHLLVALASATFMLISTQFAFHQHFSPEGVAKIDASRIASNVVVGIGFLGGGAILRSGPTVHGLTTAASLWLVASVGLAAGAGMYVVAALSTVLTLFALVVLRVVLESSRKQAITLCVRIEREGDFLGRSALLAHLAPVDVSVTRIDYTRDISSNRSKMTLDLKLPREALEEPLMRRLETLPGILRVKVKRPEAHSF